jgi:FlaG/FlaF family flagellin (archaellin)
MKKLITVFLASTISLSMFGQTNSLKYPLYMGSTAPAVNGQIYLKGSTSGAAWLTVPAVAGTHFHSGTGTGSFTTTITGLATNTTYHVRSFATNETGTSYGSDVEFTTPAYSYGTGMMFINGNIVKLY